MKTVVLDPLPPEIEQLIERRRRLGLDSYDEMWEGVYHMAPMARFGHGQLQAQILGLLGPLADRAGLLASGPFNLGKPDDFRVPDAGLHRGHPDPDATYLDTAAVVVEIVSPGDETYDKLPFYAAHGVDEMLIVDPANRRVAIFALTGAQYENARRSGQLNVDVDQLAVAIRWP